MPSLTRPAPQSPRLPLLAALLLFPLGVCADTQAATTIGSDLAGEPAFACMSGTGCTATNLSDVAGRAMTAPFDGVVVRFRVKHGPVPPGASYRMKVLSGGLPSFALEQQTARVRFEQFAPGATEVVQTADAAGRPRGVPISFGQRIGVWFAPGGVGFQSAAAGQALAEHDGDHAAGRADYTPHTGYEALINADVEPDADRDGYGDESQDNCPSVANDQGSNPCPTPLPGGGGTVPGPLVTGIPAGYVKPRIGRLARRRMSLSRLSREGLSVSIACHGACSARGALVGKSLTVGRGRRQRATGGRFRLKLRLTRTGRRELRRLRRHSRLTLRVTASDRWGRSSRRQRLTVTR